MGNDWITWAIQSLTVAALGVMTYFWKRDRDSIDKRIEENKAQTDKRIDEQKARVDVLEKKLNELPFVYTTREDFIRATTGIDQKLDKILDRIADMQKEGYREQH